MRRSDAEIEVGVLAADRHRDPQPEGALDRKGQDEGRAVRRIRDDRDPNIR
jgi:hypothetical protein